MSCRLLGCFLAFRFGSATRVHEGHSHYPCTRVGLLTAHDITVLLFLFLFIFYVYHNYFSARFMAAEMEGGKKEEGREEVRNKNLIKQSRHQISPYTRIQCKHLSEYGQRYRLGYRYCWKVWYLWCASIVLVGDEKKLDALPPVLVHTHNTCTCNHVLEDSTSTRVDFLGGGNRQGGWSPAAPTAMLPPHGDPQHTSI
ncbi:hypothetical protein HOY82DRAFT_296704 [Tuber indicum]|nr:hypothetical protein HOY82DRAFT_296704 [Tuber indicum]